MATTMSFFEQFIVNLGKGNFDLTSDTLKVMLVDGYSFDAAHENLIEASGFEISAVNGYTAGGGALTGQTWVWSALNSRVELDGNNVTWTASGGSIGPATGAILYSDTSTDDKMICYIDFGTSETALDSTDFIITWHADGILIIS